MADTERSVSIQRTENSRYEATNVRGGKLSIGSGKDDDFTPVELLLAAIGACSAIDVDVVTSRRAEPDEFTVTVRGDKIRDEAGNRMENLAVAYTVRFPEGPEGDEAREALPRAAKMSHERLCTVSRTVEVGTPVTITVNP
ncbi:OsmC family protein [Kribbella deserti]|uniref:OsmC family protein n=1 Tax=Kribbella deserti TaxID=1926257 RepID=A0ABV6QMQ7_9ACTN